MPDDANGADDLISTGEAARLLGVGRTAIRRYIEDGKLRAFRLPSGVWRIYRASVEELKRKGEDPG